MAPLLASAGGSTAMRGAATGSKLTSQACSLRIKPFSTGRTSQLAPSTRQHQQRSQQGSFRLRAAEPEAEAAAEPGAAELEPVEDNDFAFSFSDAKKNNDYAASDVEAALRFYFEGGSAPASNEDFVSNFEGGDEDASFFDDIDNNEAYDAEEFLIAGIPEAAPKKRGRGRRGDGADDDEEEDERIAAGKQLDKFKAMEDQMVLEAALEEEFGDLQGQQSGEVQVVAAQQGVWDWLTNAEAAAEGADAFGSSKLSSVRRSTAQLPSDYEVLSGFNTLKVDELDEQTRDMLELIIGDEVSEEELKAMVGAVDAEVPESSTLSEAEAAGLDALAQKALVELEVSNLPAAMPSSTDDETDMSKDNLDAYMSSLKAAANASSAATLDQVKAAMAAAGEAVEVDDEAEPADDAEVAAIIAAPDVAVPAAEQLDMAQLDSLLITAEEESGYETKDVLQELRSLAAIEEFGELDMPDDQQLEILNQYLASAEQYLSAEDDRKSTAQKMVMDGELPADVFAEDLEELPDMEQDFADDFQEALALEADDDGMPALYEEEEDDGEQWQERIIELNRVTKVVKGGKIMGFRCTALVGNSNGLVGVGCQAGREVAIAAKRALVDAKRNIVRVPLVGKGTIPHKIEAKFHAARVVLVPASDGTGVIAGTSIKSVLELAGVENVLAKRLGCRSLLNNARATIKALTQLRSLNEVAASRGVPMDRLLLPKDN